MVNIQAPEQVWLDVGCASKLAQMLAMAHWHYALYSAQNCGGKARLIGLKNVVYMVPRFPAKSLRQESTSWTCIVNCIRVDRAFPLV